MLYYIIKTKIGDKYVSGFMPENNTFLLTDNKDCALPFSILPTQLIRKYDYKNEYEIVLL